MTGPEERHGSGRGSRPLVSVIVPANNAEATLRESISSALASTFPDIEIIIVDDGSVDNTRQVAENLAELDDRIRLHFRNRGGVSAAFNSGLSLARGQYVARLDADDLWQPTKLERQLAIATRDPDVAFIYCFVRYIDGGGRVLRDVAAQRFPRWALCRAFYENLVGANSSAMMRRDVVMSLGGYDESLGSWEDLDLQLRINAHYPIAFVPEYLVGYRVRPGSLASNPHNMLSAWRKARRRLEASFSNVPVKIHRWAHGRRCGELAEGFFWRRRFGKGAALLLEALRHDPEWTLRFLQYRLGRKLRRRAARNSGVASLFLQCPPTEIIHLAPYDGRVEGKALHRLHERRIQLLAEFDRKLAERRSAGEPQGAQSRSGPR